MRAAKKQRDVRSQSITLANMLLMSSVKSFQVRSVKEMNYIAATVASPRLFDYSSQRVVQVCEISVESEVSNPKD